MKNLPCYLFSSASCKEVESHDDHTDACFHTGCHYAGMSLTKMVGVRCASAAAGLGSPGLAVKIPDTFNGQTLMLIFIFIRHFHSERGWTDDLYMT